MSTMDRRSGLERRAAERYKLTVDIEWENILGRRIGTLGDISVKGCFILGAGEIHDGEIVRLFLPSIGGTKVQLLGEVSNHDFEIGFGAFFIDLTGPQKDFLESFIGMYRQR